MSRSSTRILDIGGEGLHDFAWNLNPSAVRTIGQKKGEPIPRRIAGRAEKLPLPDQCIDLIVVERTPLCRAALNEISRVISPGGCITLRHATLPNMDPHGLAKKLLPGHVTQRQIQMYGQRVTETTFELHKSGCRGMSESVC